jgi:hypothetical protein
VFHHIGGIFSGYCKLLIECITVLGGFSHGETLDQQLEISCEKPSNTKKHSINSLQYSEKNHPI